MAIKINKYTKYILSVLVIFALVASLSSDNISSGSFSIALLVLLGVVVLLIDIFVL